jgi:hypothetical protein
MRLSVEDPTLRLTLTPDDKRKIQDAHEQTLVAEGRRRGIDDANKYLRELQPLVDAAQDLSDVLIVVSTLAMAGAWQRLQDDRFIKEIGGTHRIIREISSSIKDPEIADWNAKIQPVVDGMIIGIHRLIKEDDRSSLLETVLTFNPKALRLPPPQIRGTTKF